MHHAGQPARRAARGRLLTPSLDLGHGGQVDARHHHQCSGPCLGPAARQWFRQRWQRAHRSRLQAGAGGHAAPGRAHQRKAEDGRTAARCTARTIAAGACPRAAFQAPLRPSTQTLLPARTRYGRSATRSNMAAMAPLASGIQLADENLGARPAKFVTDANMARLDRVRADYDPDGRFYPWMGRV